MEKLNLDQFYFNSVTKTVTNHIFELQKSFEEISYMIDIWINNGSGWIIELIESQYINISTYRPLSGSSCMDLAIELKSPRKGLINIKNKDKKCFLWCHVKPIYISDQKFEDSMDLLLLIDNDKSHYVYIKDFNRFMFQKTRNKK